MTTDNADVLDVSKLPPCKVLLRSKEGVELFEIPETKDIQGYGTNGLADNERPFLCKGSTAIPLVVSPDGAVCYVHLTGQGILKCPIPETTQGGRGVVPSTTQRPFFADTQSVQMMDLSPTGAYLLTWERWNEANCPNNLKLWQTSTGNLLAAFPQKAIKRDAWPYLQWTHDEQYAAVMVTNEVRFYPVANLLGVSNTNTNNNNDDHDPAAVRYSEKLRISGIASFSMPSQASNSGTTGSSSSPPYLMTAFVPGTKQKPAKAGLYQFAPGAAIKNLGGGDATPLLGKSLFQAEDMKVHWSPAGDAALLTLQTAVDTSGQSYYGSSQLFLMRYGEMEAMAVPLPQEGPVASVGWMPDASKPSCFVVVAGKMPALASLHHGRTGKATFLFGNAHRNVVSWSPHGRFLCLAGFGNLAGGMSFWDRNKQKLINNGGCPENATGQLRAEYPVVGYDWSPSSRWFLCSTCSPRMNVDNGARMFRYNGQAVTGLPWNNDHYTPDKLLQACFVPAEPTVYPDRAQSPPPEGYDPAAAIKETTSATQPAASSNASAAAGRYIPPSARNRADGAERGSSLAERMRREKEGTLQPAARVVDKKLVTTVVGAAPQQGKSKSALKREKEKKKKQEQQQREQELQQQQQREQQQNEASSESADPEKRARKIKKTLKQIDDLKQKDGATLNDDQKAKMASEAQLLAELEELGL